MTDSKDESKQTSLIEDMDDVLGNAGVSPPMDAAELEATGGADPAPAKPAGERDVSAWERDEQGRPLDPVSKFPNPLGLELTHCHLPQNFIEDRNSLCRYVCLPTGWIDKQVVRGIVTSANERKLYEPYKKACRQCGERVVTIRMFSAAVRLICKGKPLQRSQERAFEADAL